MLFGMLHFQQTSNNKLTMSSRKTHCSPCPPFMTHICSCCSTPRDGRSGGLPRPFRRGLAAPRHLPMVHGEMLDAYPWWCKFGRFFHPHDKLAPEVPGEALHVQSLWGKELLHQWPGTKIDPGIGRLRWTYNVIIKPGSSSFMSIPQRSTKDFESVPLWQIEGCLYLFIIYQLTDHQRQQQAPKPKATITTSSIARKPYGWLMGRSIAPWWMNTLRFIDKLTNTKKNGFQVSTWKVLPVLEQQILNQKDTGYATSVSGSRLDILLVSGRCFGSQPLGA